MATVPGAQLRDRVPPHAAAHLGGAGRLIMVTTSLPRAAADLVRAAGLASLGWAVAHGQWVNAALFSLVLLGLVLPRIVGSRPLADLRYGVVLLFAAWSAVLDLYIKYDWLDVVVHTVACGLTAALAHRLLVRCGVLPTADAPGLRHPRVGLLLTTAALGTALGVLWRSASGTDTRFSTIASRSATATRWGTSPRM